jgi:hypothetical protein
MRAKANETADVYASACWLVPANEATRVASPAMARTVDPMSTSTAGASPHWAPNSPLVTIHTVTNPANPSRLTEAVLPTTMALGAVGPATRRLNVPSFFSAIIDRAAKPVVKNKKRIDIDAPKYAAGSSSLPPAGTSASRKVGGASRARPMRPAGGAAPVCSTARRAAVVVRRTRLATLLATDSATCPAMVRSGLRSTTRAGPSPAATAAL